MLLADLSIEIKLLSAKKTVVLHLLINCKLFGAASSLCSEYAVSTTITLLLIIHWLGY